MNEFEVRTLRRIWQDLWNQYHKPNKQKTNMFESTGIGLSEEWRRDRAKFVEWSLENGWNEKLVLKRWDENDTFSPDNCYWDKKQTSGEVIVDGEKYSYYEYGKKIGLSESTIRNRWEKGLRGEDLTRKKERRICLDINGEKMGILEAAKRYNLNKSAIYQRYRRGVRGDALIEPVRQGKRNEHGLSKTRLYNIWKRIKIQCYSKDSVIYQKNASGHTEMFEPWRNDFIAFHLWAMDNGYDESKRLYRKGRKGDFAPWNCEWK